MRKKNSQELSLKKKKTEDKKMFSKPRSFKDQAVSSADGLSPVNKSTSESRPQTTQSKHYISGMFRQFPLFSSLEERKTRKKFHLMEEFSFNCCFH